MRLTDLQIKKLSLPQGATKQKTFFDDTLKGFGLRVSVGGAKSFVVMYGKRRKLKTLGRYPETSLAEARVKARKAIGEVADGNDDVPARGADMPFSQAREQFLEDTRHHTKTSTLNEYRRLLCKHFDFSKTLGEIKRQDVMEIVSDLRARPSAAHHAFIAIRTIMNWAVRRGLLEVSPVPALRFKATSRARILTDEELTAVWKRAVQVGYPYGTMVQLLILAGQRRGEIAGLRRSWIKDSWLTFPTGFTKNKREHRIPIGEQCKQIIEGIKGDTDLLFPARGQATRPFSGWSKAKREFDQPLPFGEYTLHDLRRTYSSNLARLGVPIHVTEKLLNHVSGTVSGVAAVYNRHSYADEMRLAVETHEREMQKLFSF
jgi:integrase